MSFCLPKLTEPDFSTQPLAQAPFISLEEAPNDGVAPEAFCLTTHLPTWYHCADLSWTLPSRSSVNCVAVKRNGGIEVVELRDVRRCDLVVCGSSPMTVKASLSVATAFLLLCRYCGESLLNRRPVPITDFSLIL